MALHKLTTLPCYSFRREDCLVYHKRNNFRPLYRLCFHRHSTQRSFGHRALRSEKIKTYTQVRKDWKACFRNSLFVEKHCLTIQQFTILQIGLCSSSILTIFPALVSNRLFEANDPLPEQFSACGLLLFFVVDAGKFYFFYYI